MRRCDVHTLQSLFLLLWLFLSWKTSKAGISTVYVEICLLQLPWLFSGLILPMFEAQFLRHSVVAFCLASFFVIVHQVTLYWWFPTQPLFSHALSFLNINVTFHRATFTCVLETQLWSSSGSVTLCQFTIEQLYRDSDAIHVSDRDAPAILFSLCKIVSQISISHGFSERIFLWDVSIGTIIIITTKCGQQVKRWFPYEKMARREFKRRSHLSSYRGTVTLKYWDNRQLFPIKKTATRTYHNVLPSIIVLKKSFRLLICPTLGARGFRCRSCLGKTSGTQGISAHKNSEN